MTGDIPPAEAQQSPNAIGLRQMTVNKTRRPKLKPVPLEKYSLDSTDLKILTLLAKNGRMSFRAIAGAVGLTTKSAKSRVDRMFKSRVIEKFIVFVNPAVAGYHRTYSFTLRKNILTVEMHERIRLVGEIQYRFEVMGGVVGFAIATREGDDHKMEILSDSLKPALIVKKVQAHIGPLPYALTRSDYLIMKRLLRNPRMEVTEIAEATSVSPKTVRRRLERLLKSRVIHFSIIINPDAMKGHAVFFLEVRSDVQDYRRLLEMVYVALGDRPVFFTDLSSPQDSIGFLVGGTDASEMESIRSQIESVDGVKAANVFVPTKIAYFQDGIIRAIDRWLAKDASRGRENPTKGLSDKHDMLAR